MLADDASLFPVVHDINSFASDIIKEPIVKSDWAFQWRTIFDPDLGKLAQDIRIMRLVNDNAVSLTSVHRHI